MCFAKTSLEVHLHCDLWSAPKSCLWRPQRISLCISRAFHREGGQPLEQICSPIKKALFCFLASLFCTGAPHFLLGKAFHSIYKLRSCGSWLWLPSCFSQPASQLLAVGRIGEKGWHCYFQMAQSPTCAPHLNCQLSWNHPQVSELELPQYMSFTPRLANSLETQGCTPADKKRWTLFALWWTSLSSFIFSCLWQG